MQNPPCMRLLTVYKSIRLHEVCSDCILGARRHISPAVWLVFCQSTGLHGSMPNLSLTTWLTRERAFLRMALLTRDTRHVATCASPLLLVGSNVRRVLMCRYSAWKPPPLASVNFRVAPLKDRQLFRTHSRILSDTGLRCREKTAYDQAMQFAISLHLE